MVANIKPRFASKVARLTLIYVAVIQIEKHFQEDSVKSSRFIRSFDKTCVSTIRCALELLRSAFAFEFKDSGNAKSGNHDECDYDQ
jgi:hypothetical protein